jgi:serine/threonine protein kinase
MPLTPGTILGQYEIRSPLGAGGMGEVYRAHDTRLDREVAIKVLPESLTADPDRLRRFEQEARAARAFSDNGLRSPPTIRLLCFVTPGPRNFIK